jgi:hypothetical protein
MRLRYITTDATEVTKKDHIWRFSCVNISLLFYALSEVNFLYFLQVTDLRWREPVKDSDDEEGERYSDDEIDINDNAES